MFTVKVVHAEDGVFHRTTGYEARSYEIIDSDNQKAVIAHMEGDDLYVPVRKESNHEGCAAVVFIENASGNTTDVVRP